MRAGTMLLVWRVSTPVFGASRCHCLGPMRTATVVPSCLGPSFLQLPRCVPRSCVLKSQALSYVELESGLEFKLFVPLAVSSLTRQSPPLLPRNPDQTTRVSTSPNAPDLLSTAYRLTAGVTSGTTGVPAGTWLGAFRTGVPPLTGWQWVDNTSAVNVQVGASGNGIWAAGEPNNAPPGPVSST
jgi:hypothetical protein